MKHKFRNLCMISFLAIAGIFGISSALVSNSVIKEAKADSDTTYSTSQIVIHIIDDATQTSSGHDMWIHCWNISVSSDCIFTDINNAYDTPGALWSKLKNNFSKDNSDPSKSAINFAGSYEWFQDGDYGRRSYKFDFPWWITNFSYTVNIDGVYSITNITDSRNQYERRYYKNTKKLEGYSSASASYNAPAYTMTFDTNGGSAQSSFVFREWQKTTAPGTNPTKFNATFDKWTETNSPSASAFSFGSNLTAPITLYAQWTSSSSYGMILWLPNRESYFNGYTKVHYWGDGFTTTWPGEDRSGTITINGTTYYYFNPTLGTPTAFILHNNGGGDYNQTDDIGISSSQLQGSYYYNLRDSKGDGGKYGSGWVALNISISYYDQGGGARTGTPSSTLPSKFAFGSDSQTLPTLSKNGYKFGGWFTDSACTGTQVTTVGGYGFTSNLTLYAKWTNGSSDAISFASAFNNTVGNICKNDGSTVFGDLRDNWNNSQEITYNALGDHVTYYLLNNPASNATIAAFRAKYNYILSKYGYSESPDDLHDFMGTAPLKAAIKNFSPFALFGNDENNLSTVIIIVSSSVALLSVTALSILVIRKRKSKEQE